VNPSRGGVAAKDSTLIAGPNTKWTAADNFTSATDENGKPVDLSKVTVDGSVNPNKAGSYPVTYSYTDAQGNPYSQKVTVTVNPSKGGVAAKDSTLIAGPNTKWTAADNFSGATDEDGKPVDLSKVTVDGSVDPTTPGTYPVTYSYTDAQGNPYSQKITVTVVSSKDSITMKDSTLIAGPNTRWTPADNFSGATDANGQPIDLSKITVTGHVDTTKPGTYPVTYSYTDETGNHYSKTVTVTVNSSKGSLTAKDSTLIAGPDTKWTPADNFSGATDENGQPVDLSKVTVDGTVDTTKPGSYPITYTYTDGEGNTHSQKVTVTVNPSKGSLTAKDSTLIAGPDTKWTPADNFSGATDENGQPVDLSKVTVDGKVDPTTPGTYPVTYSYTDAQGNKQSQTATITVVASKDSITIKGGNLIAGPSTKWTPADSFSGATDANGQPIDLTKITVTGHVDTTKPGTYPVTYSYTDETGNHYSKTVTITVTQSKGGITTKDSHITVAPNTNWSPADGFSGATDENGQPVGFSKIKVTGQVDTTKPGTYPVTYSYTDGSGNIYTQTVTVTVTSGNDTTSNTNQGSKTTPSSSGQSTTQGSEKTPSNSGQSTTQKSETSSTIATPSQVNTSDSLVNATPKTTSVLPQTGKHQTRSMDLEALEIGMISATFGLILLMKRNKKNGID
ncbi:bacterial Ig-like domain-containing protein, partial [Fructobacillus tropaeoli]|uniref:bacterial Ig-like domain-containing protein n=1 Tax=Fructobacillus tropaeoli TaxID=709323 RepID=UPI0030C7FA06